jgi:hypothetical protein
MPPVMAPLADPNAVQNDVIQDSVEQCKGTVWVPHLKGNTSAYDGETMFIAKAIVSEEERSTPVLSFRVWTI